MKSLDFDTRSQIAKWAERNWITFSYFPPTFIKNLSLFFFFLSISFLHFQRSLQRMYQHRLRNGRIENSRQKAKGINISIIKLIYWLKFSFKLLLELCSSLLSLIIGFSFRDTNFLYKFFTQIITNSKAIQLTIWISFTWFS